MYDYAKTAELLSAAVFSVLGIIFPVLFHMAGAGPVFLPMYLPLSAGAFLLHPGPAAMTGFCVPLISSVLTGMPVMYPPAAFMMSVQLSVLCFLISFLRQKSRLPFPVIAGLSLLAERLVQFFLFSAVMPLFSVSCKVFAFYENIKSMPGIILMVTAVPAAARAAESFLKKRSPVFAELRQADDDCSCIRNPLRSGTVSGLIPDRKNFRRTENFMQTAARNRVPVMKICSAVILVLNISLPAENSLLIYASFLSGLAVCMFISGISLKVFVKRNLLLLVPAGIFFLIMTVSSAVGKTSPDLCLMTQVTAKIFCVFTAVTGAAGWIGMNGFQAAAELIPSGTFRLYIILICRELSLLKKDFLQIRGAALSRISGRKIFLLKYFVRSFILQETGSFPAKQAVLAVRTCSVLPESLPEQAEFRDAAAALAVSVMSAAGLIIRCIK